MAEFKMATVLLGDEYPELDVCSNNGTPVQVFQWQPQGVLVLNQDRGVKCEDTQFIEKARSFIQTAREQHVGLVLTPEYSFPYLVLEEIISDNTKWPEQGKLWCLGTQGESRETFNDIMMEWKTKSDIEVIDYAYNNLGVESFVCPLIYLFVTRTGRLCIIPQFKTYAMADPRLFFEGPRLCRGQTIFVFESNVSDCENVFFSLICADAIGINCTEIFQAVSKKSIILYNPQLNPNPRYDRMLALRDELINNTRLYEVRIITLNWSANTQVANTTVTFNKPWSAFYKRKGDKYLPDAGFRVNKENNHKKGTGYALNGHVEIWFSHRHEHCKSFFIRKGDHGSLPPVLTSGDEPKTDGSFVFDVSGSWIPDTDCCMSNIDQLFTAYGAISTLPYPACQSHSRGSSCDQCQKCDFFFGSLFGHFEEGELRTTNSELVQRLLVGSDYESDEERADKLSLVVELQRILAAGNIPSELGYFVNNYAFFVHNDFPDLGRQIVNLRPIDDPGHTYPEALVVITDKKREEDVEIILTGLMDRISCNYRNQILIYYRPVTRTNFIYYDKHLTGTGIMQPSFDDNLALIMNPRINMDRR